MDQPAGPSPRESLSTQLHEAVSHLAATRASFGSQLGRMFEATGLKVLVPFY